MKISLLGSTGSIGQQTLSVAQHLGLEVVALAAHSNTALLEEQARTFNVKKIAVVDEAKAHDLKARLPGCQIYSGMVGVEELAALDEADTVVHAISGSAGIRSAFAAARAGKRVALACKEVLVAAGTLFMDVAQECGAQILPVDSEHSAIFQCLNGEKMDAVNRLILTASGGPFWKTKREISLESALQHPTWAMGPKNTIDSSTLMNKGLEVIEAHVLFGLRIDQIEVVVHPQSFVHSFVEFVDGSLIAQASEPDMRLPIQYALTYPERRGGQMKPFDFTKNHSFEFFPPDHARFPCLNLAFEAARVGGSMPCFMNAVNEGLVGLFLERKIGWAEIGARLEKHMNQHSVVKDPDLETLLTIDSEAKAAII